MKKCPFCQTEYGDPTQKYCLNDGAVLVEGTAGSYDSQATVLSPSQSAPNNLAPTVASSAGAASHGGWTAPPPPYIQPAQPQRSKLPWILGGLLALIAVLGLIGVAGLVAWQFFIYHPDQNNRNGNRQIAVDTSNRPKSDNRNLAVPSPVPASNTNSGYGYGPLVKESPVMTDDSAPVDADEVLAILTALENDWMRANVSGDRATLDRILASDYKGILSDGSIKTKQVYLANAAPDKNVKSWSISGLALKLNKRNATVTGTVNWVGPKETSHFRFKDDFVWRDGRWQAVGSINLPPA